MRYTSLSREQMAEVLRNTSERRRLDVSVTRNDRDWAAAHWLAICRDVLPDLHWPPVWLQQQIEAWVEQGGEFRPGDALFRSLNELVYSAAWARTHIKTQMRDLLAGNAFLESDPVVPAVLALLEQVVDETGEAKTDEALRALREASRDKHEAMMVAILEMEKWAPLPMPIGLSRCAHDWDRSQPGVLVCRVCGRAAPKSQHEVDIDELAAKQAERDGEK